MNSLKALLRRRTRRSVYSITAGDKAERLALQIAPLHVGPMMEEYLNQRMESIILTSATLRTQDNFDHIKGTALYRELQIGRGRLAI